MVHCFSLTHLTIHCLSDEAMAIIAMSCPLLQRFDLNHDSVCDCVCRLSDVGVRHLARSCTRLNTLILSGFPAAGASPNQALALLENGLMDRYVDVIILISSHPVHTC